MLSALGHLERGWLSWSVGLQAQINHGTFFHVAATEGLLSNTSVHAGIRCKLGEHGFFSTEGLIY